MATPQNLPNGKRNPKYVDLLDEDPGVGGQKYCCISFVSPDKIIEKREEFFFRKFIQKWDFEKSVKTMTEFLNFISFKHNIKFDVVMEDFQDYLKNEKTRILKESSKVSEDYSTFIEQNEQSLQEEFDETHQFQTSTRGIKIRGSYGTVQEAQLRAKLLREKDPNHDIYVGQVGVWMPWEPDAYKTGNVDYLEEELNQLMVEKKKNEQKAKEEFDQRVRESKEKAIEDNIRKAKESGNKLTQNINDDGELVGVQGGSSVEKTIEQNKQNENTIVSGADIRRELFEGEEIRTKEKDDAYKKELKQKFGRDISGTDAMPK
jgi:hypothetical protein